MKAKEKAEPRSLGTIVSEKLRTKANKDSDDQRAASIAQGMALIYGGGKNHAKTAHRR